MCDTSLVVMAGRRGLYVSAVVLVLGCGGQSRRESFDHGDAGARGGDASGGTAGETGGSAGRGGEAGAVARGGSTDRGGTSSSGGTAGSVAGSAGTGDPPAIPPLPCNGGEPVELPFDVTVERISRLFFRTAAPDAYVEAARRNGLATTGAVGCFTRELLDDVRADAGIADFFDGWLDLGKYAVPSQDQTAVPEFTPELFARAKSASLFYATSMARFDTFTALLTDQSVALDEELALLYGASGVRGSEFRLVEFGAQRSGILTQPYFLMSRTTRAHGSPAQRGGGLSRMLGCVDLVAPPSDLNASVPVEFEGTTRAWYEEQVLAYAPCAGCHAYLTMTGFAFEHFDVLGRYRDEEAGEPVDASADLYALEIYGTNDHTETMQAAAQSPLARRCMAEHWLAYAVASLRGERAYAVPDAGLDQGAVDHVVARASFDADFYLREMFIASVETAPFLAPLP